MKKSSPSIVQAALRPKPRVWASFRIGTGSKTLIGIGESDFLFMEHCPVAVQAYDVVYFPDTGLSSSMQRQINAFHPSLPHVRLDIFEYDFVVGASLTRLGVQLAHKPKPEGTPAEGSLTRLSKAT